MPGVRYEWVNLARVAALSGRAGLVCMAYVNAQVVVALGSTVCVFATPISRLR